MTNKYSLYKELEELEDILREAIVKAKRLSDLSKNKTFSGQIDLYLLRNLQSFTNNKYQPGSIESLKEILEDCEENIKEVENEIN